jgi:glucuronosyltransferase
MADAIAQERGLALNVHDVTEQEIYEALTEILNNPKYKKNAEEVAKRFNDRVMTPQQQIVYWTEYVARHKGAPFLRSAGCDLNAFEFYSLDVYCLMLAILLVAFYIQIKILKVIFRKLTGRSGQKQKIN